jgi:hypothetical protein
VLRPGDNYECSEAERILVIACGALAREITLLGRYNGWNHMQVQCLAPELHNRPSLIPDAVRAKIRAARGKYAAMFVAYGDCGTGGLLDAVLAEEGVDRIPGAHCYEFFAGRDRFAELADAEPGTFYLTDFLARHFERLIWAGLGLDRHPELAEQYFGNYRRLVYLSQVEDAGLEIRARQAADRLGLEYAHQPSGFGDLERSLTAFATRIPVWPS